MDSSVFTTRDQKPSALSIVTQWTVVKPIGVTFGQGVRCMQGPFKRRYQKAASGGSITAPTFGAAFEVRSVALTAPGLGARSSRRRSVHTKAWRGGALQYAESAEGG